MILEEPEELSEKLVQQYTGFDDQQKSDLLMFILKLRQDLIEINEN